MAELGRMDAARRDDTCLFRLRGEFDLSNAWKVRDALLASIENEQRDIVVDLSEVGFMDAQLARALVRARTEAIEHDIAFVVVPPRDQVVSRIAALVDFDI